MIWLTWRQSRGPVAVVAAALAVLAAVLAITVAGLSQLANTTSGTAFLNGLTSLDSTLYTVGAAAVLAVPGLVGVFWGAPLITRELEAGTHRLVWNQGVTRTRWLATKLGCTGLLAMAAAGLTSLLVTWWAGPIDTAVDGTTATVGFYFPQMFPVLFDTRGIVPVGYAAFAFTLGVTIGVFVRNTLPAMAATLGAYLAVQVAVPLWLRPNLMAPVTTTTPITMQNMLNITGNSLNVASPAPGAWIIAQHTVDTAGNQVGMPSWFDGCLGTSNVGACVGRLTSLGYRQVVDYQPASRFWTFQWYELTIYLALALVLGGFCAWWVRRRVS
ncbi:MAG TPA: ABC transporter permease [Pseudonocardiaceae bacterium]|jgi:ABC-type transport system involved in multi-copper enzyme maturation permease subunit